MNSTFTTHASVRIKGTENNYNPIPCFDQLCQNKSPHMHCPFCVKSDCYNDPVILKAHYRVKHVDKGIEFAGLKILRCCDHCDIVGIIKGEKKFKGAHWHCYKCKNGFNRRDEAIKHYKTHFRNPQTTFQIQITQEVNQPMSASMDHMTGPTSLGDEMSIHPVLTEAITCMATSEDHGFHQASQSSLLNGKLDNMHVPVASNEIDVSETQTIMIIQEDGNTNSLDTSLNTQTEANEAEDTEDNDIIDVPSPTGSEGHFDELAERCQQLEREKQELEVELRAQIQELQNQVDLQVEEIAKYQKREADLMNQLSIPLDKGIQELLKQLQTQHKALLHQQLAYLKRNYLSGGAVTSESVDTETNPTNNHQIILIGQDTEMAVLETFSVQQSEGAEGNSVQSVEVQEFTSDNLDASANLSVSAKLTKAEDISDAVQRTTGHDGSGDHLENKSDFVDMVKAEMAKHNLSQPIKTDVELTNNADSDSDMVPIENDGYPPTKRRKH